MFECFHCSILCLAQKCRFNNKLKTVIIHSINCPYHLFNCALCTSKYNVSYVTHECDVIKSQRLICSNFKYYNENLLPNYLN